jgi:hypothetical protein
MISSAGNRETFTMLMALLSRGLGRRHIGTGKNAEQPADRHASGDDRCRNVRS